MLDMRSVMRSPCQMNLIIQINYLNQIKLFAEAYASSVDDSVPGLAPEALVLRALRPVANRRQRRRRP